MLARCSVRVVQREWMAAEIAIGEFGAFVEFGLLVVLFDS
jgi:hypothetical protein